MCIIIAIPKGIKTPKLSEIEVCMDNNPDGAGIAVAKRDYVLIQKGFFTPEKLWKAIKKNRTNEAMLIHCRIATVGEVDAATTQPLPMEPSSRRQRRTSLKTRMAMAHNGTLPITPMANLSDSQTLAAIIGAEGKRFFSEASLNIALKQFAKNNRWAFLNANGKIIVMGNGWITDKYRKYSNDSYKDTPVWTMSPEWRTSAYCRNWDAQSSHIQPAKLWCPYCGSIVRYEDGQGWCPSCEVGIGRYDYEDAYDYMERQ